MAQHKWKVAAAVLFLCALIALLLGVGALLVGQSPAMTTALEVTAGVVAIAFVLLGIGALKMGRR